MRRSANWFIEETQTSQIITHLHIFGAETSAPSSSSSSLEEEDPELENEYSAIFHFTFCSWRISKCNFFCHALEKNLTIKTIFFKKRKIWGTKGFWITVDMDQYWWLKSLFFKHYCEKEVFAVSKSIYVTLRWSVLFFAGVSESKDTTTKFTQMSHFQLTWWHQECTCVTKIKAFIKLLCSRKPL